MHQYHIDTQSKEKVFVLRGPKSASTVYAVSQSTNLQQTFGPKIKALKNFNGQLQLSRPFGTKVRLSVCSFPSKICGPLHHARFFYQFFF